MMFGILFLHLSLVCAKNCKTFIGSDLKGMFSHGDIILGGVFPISETTMEDHPVLKGHPPVPVCIK